MTGDTVPVDIRKPVVGSSSCGPYYLTDWLRFASEGRESLLIERYTCHSTITAVSRIIHWLNH